jgi:hypothetical protein
MKFFRASVIVLALCPLANLAIARTTILMPLDQEPSWHDMAFLAATAAAERANNGGGSLIGLPADEKIGPEIRDYLLRYQPETLIQLNESGQIGTSVRAVSARRGSRAIKVSSAPDASLKLSREFWKSSRTVVLVRANDFDSALVGAPLAALLKAPLIIYTGAALPSDISAEIKRLGAKEVIALGAKPTGAPATTTLLPGATEVMTWVKRKGISVSYLAAVNPLDREKFTTRKLSLAGAQLAAGRGGLVAPLKFNVEWKRAFDSTPFTGALPQGVPKSVAPAKSGTLAIGAASSPFILTGKPEEHDLRLSVDKGGKGQYSAPLASGDEIELDGRKWAVSLGTRTKFGKTDVHLTWPTADVLKIELEKYYKAVGSRPKHLCLVGFPDALPHAIIGQGGIVEEQASDLPYAMVGQGQFAEIGVARLIAENASFATLYASRALTYSKLAGSGWQDAAGQAEWENSLGPLFENVGFKNPYHLATSEIPWKVAPAPDKEGVRAPSFAQNSPLARSAIIAHSEHSWWRGLGSMFTSDAEVILAPTVVESGGCGTACLDREVDNRSVVARLLRQGAVSFAGGSREHSAEAQPLRMEFWNAVLEGETLGQAHKRALNAGLLIIKNQKEGPGGAYRYNTNIRMQFGDPALALKVPSAPKTAPARIEVKGTRVSVFAPQKWSIVKMVVPPDWKDWAGKDLFAVRGPGAVAMASWSGDGHDKEILLVKAVFSTDKPVKGIKQSTSTQAPLGWKGTWYSSRNLDGTYTHRFAVRMIDFDEVKGKIRSQVDRLDYELTFD